MLLGGNFSSGYTNTINDKAIRAGIPKAASESRSDICCKTNVSGQPPVARYPSMVLLGKTCTPPIPSEFALYPKVAVPCSVYTERVASRVSDVSSNLDQRFAKYNRYQPPLPCAPLPASANMAGISKPSISKCNIKPSVI